MIHSTRTFRTRLARAIAVFGGITLTAAVVCAQKNPVTTAAACLRLERVARTDWPATMGVVDIAPCLNAPYRFGVFDGDGKPVAFQTVWSGQGEATRVSFDTSSGATIYYVCFDAGLPTAGGSWKAEAGVLLETRPCRSDLPIDTAPQIARVLSTAGGAAGRDFVPNVFLGANPFGPSTNYIATFNGWFTVPSAAQYTFATASDDASYLEVDNRTVATWFGGHGAEPGAHGEHNGTISLSAGPHRLSYVQIQIGGPSAAVAAWKPPGHDHVELMPPSAFLAVARFHVTRIEFGPSAPEQLYFEWRSVDQCELGDAMLVRLQFHAVNNTPGRTYRWQFDDGAEDTGVNPRHFFPQPGLRQVTLESLKNGTVVATNSIRLRVEPEWQQRDWWRDDVFNQGKTDFLHRDLTLTPPRDLIAVWDLAERADDQELLTRIGETLVKREEDFNGTAAGPIFYRMGLLFEHQGDSGDALAEKSFRLVLAPQRVTPAINERAKLGLAALLIHYSGELDEAGKLLGGIPGGSLNADDRKLWRLLQGDLLLARGRNEEARKQYAAAAGKQSGEGFNAARAARLESAAILFEHSDWEDAQTALDGLQLEMPLERMSLDTGLLALRLEMARKEFKRALNDGETLLSVAGEDPRQSEILYTVVETGLTLGKREEAQRALSHLLKDFPYSEAAAKAKEKWTKK